MVGQRVDAAVEICVKAPNGGEMDVAAENRDAEIMRGGNVLQGFDKILALGLVGTGSPVVVQIIK